MFAANKQTQSNNSSDDESEIIPENTHREDVGFAYELISSDDELNPHEAIALLPQVFFPMTIELLDGYTQHGTELKDCIKQFWQSFYDKLVRIISVAEVQALTQSFCKKLGELSQRGWFALQVTPSQNPINNILFTYHKDLTSSGITLWQAYWSAFIKQPTEKNVLVQQKHLIESLATLEKNGKLKHEDSKFIYNEFAIKSTLCLDYVKMTEQKLAMINQPLNHSEESTKHVDDTKLSSPNLSVESHAQNLYQYGKMLLEKRIVPSKKEALKVLASKIDKLQETGQISSVQSLMVARGVMALFNPVSSSLSNDPSVKITPPDSPRPSSPTPSAYNPWISNPWEDYLKITHQSQTTQGFSKQVDIDYLSSLPSEDLHNILNTLPPAHRDEVEMQIAVKQSLSF